MVMAYSRSRRNRTLDRMLRERAEKATVRAGRKALTFADSQKIATANGLITQAARAGYPNTGFLPYGDQHYPEMEKVEPGKVPLAPVGATGTQIFAGIIAEDSEYNPDFYWRDKIDVYEKMRRNDGQVKAVERAIMQPIKSTEWYIKPASTSARDQEIAALVESCMFKDRIYRTTEGRLIKQSWQQVLHHILLFLPMGFSVMAKWFYLDDQDFAKWARWEPMMQKTIWRWWVGADTELTGIQQRAFLDYQIQFLDVAIERLLVFIHEQEGNNFDGTSILRSAYKHWYFKENFYKLQAITVERTATLPPIATLAPEVWSDSMQQQMMQVLANMRVSEQMGITVPAGVAIEFPRNYQRGESESDRAIEHHDAMIARSLLADFLNLGTGSNTGSYSLADVKAELFIQCEEGHCKALENVINTDAIPELVNYNYDGVDVYPELVHRPIAKADLKAVAALFTAGALTQDPEMQDFVRNLLGAPLAPRNVVQSTNPTSPASPPEGGTQAPMEQGKKADATSGESADDATATGDGGAGGDAGAAGMAESLSGLQETARLFAEAARAISGADVVERGLTFYNPNHDARGRFAPGGAGGASGSSGGRSRGEGAARGSRGTGAGGSKGEGARSGSGSRSGGASGGSGGAGSRSSSRSGGSKSAAKKTEDEKYQAKRARLQKEMETHAAAYRAANIAHRDDEAFQHQMKYGAAKVALDKLEAAHAGSSKSAKTAAKKPEGEKTVKPKRGGTKEERVANARQRVADAETRVRNVQQEPEGETRTARHISARADLQAAQEHLARMEGRKLAPGEAAFTREEYLNGKASYHAKDGTVHRVSPEEARANLEASHAAIGTKSAPKAVRSGTTRTTRAPRTPKEDPFATKLTPVGHVEGRDINPGKALDPHFLRAIYGDAQLHAAIGRNPGYKIREAAENLGIRRARSTEGTISRIVEHVTRSPYADVLAHYQRHPNTPYHHMEGGASA